GLDRCVLSDPKRLSVIGARKEINGEALLLGDLLDEGTEPARGVTFRVPPRVEAHGARETVPTVGSGAMRPTVTPTAHPPIAIDPEPLLPEERLGSAQDLAAL